MELENTCYYHGDLDGITAARVVLQQYSDAKMIRVNYGDKWKDEDVVGKRVIIVDFSFPDMMDIHDKCAELVWCDHHKTAKSEQKKLWGDDNVAGLRSLDYAGCMLTYAFFNNIKLADIVYKIQNFDIPYVVRAVATYDMWHHKAFDDVDAFCAAAFVKLTSPDAADFERLFNNNKAIENEYIATGEVLLQAALNRIRHVAGREEILVLKPYSGDISVMFVNSTSDISALGSYINKELDCDIAIIFEIIGEKRKDVEYRPESCRVSLRSRTCNVEIVARELAGGGHPGAAGFSTAETPSKMRDTLQGIIYRIGHQIKVK